MAQDEKQFRAEQRKLNQMAGYDDDLTMDERLAGVSARDTQRGKASWSTESAAERARLDEELDRLEQEAQIGPVIKNAAIGAAIPASFLGGPVGMAAGGALALEGITNAISDPSVMNAGMATLGSMPVVGSMMKGARVAQGGARAARYTGGLGSASKDVMPIGAATGGSASAGARTSSSYRPSMNLADVERDERMATRMLDDLPMEPAFPRAMKQRRPASLEAMDADFEDVAQGMGSMDEVAETIASHKQALTKIPTSKKIPRIEQLDEFDTPQEMGSMDDVNAAIANMSRVPWSRNVLDSKVDDTIGRLRRQKEHGVAGFSNLPSLSDSELARISANIKRVTGK